jgi:FMN-dependent NADH-azoreductase
MKKILHLSCSPRGEAAESFRLSSRIVELLRQQEPAAAVTHRVIGHGTVPHIDANYAISQASLHDVSLEGSMALSEILVGELESADIVVMGTPMHNLTVPSALKAWLDHVVRARRTFDMTAMGKVGTLPDRPIYIAVASGGRFSGEHARQPDFLTPYITTILAMIGLRDLRFFSVQATAAGPEAVAATRIVTESALQSHFASGAAKPRVANR